MLFFSIGAYAFEFESRETESRSYSINVKIPELNFDEVNTEDGLFTSITAKDISYGQEIGNAKLPVVNYLVEIFYGSTPEIVVESISWDYTSLGNLNLPNKIIPVQRSLEKNLDSTQEFEINENYYLKNSFEPSSYAKVTEIGNIRGHLFALVQISPVQYNPKTSEIKIMESCEIKINQQKVDIKKTTETINRYYSKTYEDMYDSLFENHYLFDDLDSPLRDDDSYLIIAYDDFYEEILPLKDFKEGKGFDVTVTKTSQISGGPTKENIRDYIEYAYNNWPNPPTYVLLVGDTNQIPTFTGQDSNTAADLYYVTVTQGDYFPDIFIGRFPAATEAHVTSMVDKTIYYEQGYFSSNHWIKKAALMASVDNYQISEGTHNYVISNYLEPNDYDVDKLYCVTYSATTQDVTNSLNDGKSLAVFSGHGGEDYWWDGPYFDQGHVNALTNEGMYPFVCSHACVTGKFNIGECFGETWLRVENKGGIAFWGSSANTLWDEDDILEKKMFYSWWEDDLGTISAMTDMALYYLYQHYGGGGFTRYYFECYNILGDPSINVWTESPSDNQPPEVPNQPEGSNEGDIGVEYMFSTDEVSDPEGNPIEYKFDWGDETNSGWISLPEASHAWSQRGQYEVKVKARDNFSAESAWSEPLIVTILGSDIMVESLTGGNGVTANIKNFGTADAIDVVLNVSVEGGLFILLPTMYYEFDSIGPGEVINQQIPIVGIGLGLISDMPEITVSAQCSMGTNDTKSIDAMVIINNVIVQK